MPKGNSPIINGLLLVTFFIAIILVGLGLYKTFADTTATKIATGFAFQINYTKTNLEIIDAFCVNADKSAMISVAIANTGAVDLTSPQFYFKSTDGEICTSQIFSDNLTPAMSKVYKINCTESNSAWDSSKTLNYAKVTTKYLDQPVISEKSNILDPCS